MPCILECIKGKEKVERERERGDNGWSVTEQPLRTCGCILALFHEITVVADAGQTGSSCFALRSPVTDAGTACTLGMGRGARCWVLIVFVLWGWAQRVLRPNAYSASILGIGREGCGRRCQTEWDWWQDITRSWSQSRRTHGAINYTDCGG